MKRSLLLCLFLTGACGDEKDGPTDPGSKAESGSVPSKLRQALDSLRASGEDLCEVTDRCYPDEIEEGWCNLPTSGFERDWPHEDADICWLPVYEKSAQATLDALACLAKSNRVMDTCLQECPDSDESWDCHEAASDAEDDCIDALTRAVGVKVMNESDACDEELHPSDEEEEEQVRSGP